MAVGAQGVISVASNVIPREVSQMVQAFARGDVKTAACGCTQKFYPRVQGFVHRDQPGAGQGRAGDARRRSQEEYRLPLVQMSAANRAKLKATLKACGNFEMKSVEK